MRRLVMMCGWLVSVIMAQEWTPAWKDAIISPRVGSFDWNSARAVCASISNGCKASLPMPKTPAEMQATPNSHLVGIFQAFYWGQSPDPPIEPAGGWFYLDMTPVSRSLWNSGEPSHAHENCAARGGWGAVDIPCDYAMSVACQIAPCLEQWEILGDKEYKLFHVSKTWAQSREFCREWSPALESDLIVLPTLNETKEMIRRMPFASTVWIGVYREIQSGSWVSVDTSQVIDESQAMQLGSVHNCAAISKTSSASARDCFSNRFFICQRTRCFPGSSTESGTCRNCSAGSFSRQFNYANCTSCSAGTFQESEGATFCKECPVGRYSLPGSSFCLGCLQGKYQESRGQSFCVDCPERFSSEQGAVQCSLCPIGSIPNGTEGCVSCEPQGTTTKTGSTSCICKEGSFGQFPDCIACPLLDDVRCPVDSFYPQLDSGLWMDPENPTLITKCIPAHACSKTVGNTTFCSPGYSGLFCSQCAEGFYRSSSSCQKCGYFFIGILLFFLVVILLVVLSVRFLQSEGTLPIDWKICLHWVQTLSFLPELALKWPSNLSTLFSIASFSNLNLELFSPECSVPISFSIAFHLKANLLWMFGAILLLALAIQIVLSKTRFKNLFKTHSLKITLSKLFNALIVVYVALFTYTVLNLFSPIRCSRQVDGRLLMTSNLNIQCGSEEWKLLFTSMLLYCILYLVIIPMIIGGLFWRFRHRIGTPEEQVLIGGLTRPYKVEFFWWEIVNVAKKISLTLSLTLPFDSRNTVFFVVLVLFMCLEIMIQPFKLNIQGQLNSLWSLSILLIIGTGFSTSMQSSSESTSTRVVSAFVLIIFCLVFAFSFRSLLQCLRDRKRRTTIQDRQQTTTAMTIPVDPDLKTSDQILVGTLMIADDVEIKMYRSSRQIMITTAEDGK